MLTADRTMLVQFAHTFESERVRAAGKRMELKDAKSRTV